MSHVEMAMLANVVCFCHALFGISMSNLTKGLFYRMPLSL